MVELSPLAWIALIFGGIGAGFLIVTLPGMLIRKLRERRKEPADEEEEVEEVEEEPSYDRPMLQR